MASKSGRSSPSGAGKRYRPRHGCGQRQLSKTKAGWLIKERGGPSGLGRIASPCNSASKPRPRPWKGRSEDCTRP
ncbi:hypothetical protein Pyn_26620 [Prunus yedoensis var. nudiflora]|uniref:Uncharacterized protein n=1 Tax=Prunus yedoensis var. nudiflora TaxID=2094558 RepID=A0A314ULA2_PRUYE|nr:hypothetical protein Pyn_26620 [Prunus yedoensis var. nudiflora]